MEQLIHYLIENRYVDNETSAEKILSVISDQFYNELVESATQRLSQLNAQMRQIMRDGGDLTKIAAEIKAAKAASAKEYKDKGSPREQPAPATRGDRPQTPSSGAGGQRYSREGHRNFDAEQDADKLVGRIKSAHLTSTTPIHMQGSTQSYVATGDRRSTRRGVTGDRSGTLRAGAIENENRFDRSR